MLFRSCVASVVSAAVVAPAITVAVTPVAPTPAARLVPSPEAAPGEAKTGSDDKDDGGSGE